MNRFFTMCFVVLTLLGTSLFAYDVTESITKDAMQKRLQPVGEDTVGGSAAATTAVVQVPNGQKVYDTYCVACHGQGIAGSPKFGDKAAWAPREKQGRDTLLAHAIHGIRAMPPKGTCTSCSDTDIGEALDYMLSKVK